MSAIACFYCGHQFASREDMAKHRVSRPVRCIDDLERFFDFDGGSWSLKTVLEKPREPVARPLSPEPNPNPDAMTALEWDRYRAEHYGLARQLEEPRRRVPSRYPWQQR